MALQFKLSPAMASSAGQAEAGILKTKTNPEHFKGLMSRHENNCKNTRHSPADVSEKCNLKHDSTVKD